MESEKISSLQFCTDDYDSSEKVDALNQFSKGLYQYSPCSDLDLDDSRAGDPFLRLQAWSMPTIAAASFEHSPLCAVSTNVVDPNFIETVVIRIVLHGQVEVVSGAHQCVMKPGNIYIIQSDNTLTPNVPGASIAVRIPCADLGYDSRKRPNIMAFPADNWAGRVVVSSLASLFEALPHMTVREAQDSDAMICSLIRSLLESRPSDDETKRDMQRARHETMRRFVLQHLRDTSLNTTRLQIEFGASRATVYRAFENLGGVAGFVREKRLNAIYHELSSSPSQRGLIREIAERYGYYDPSAFAKAFKRHYSFTPSDIVGSRRNRRNVRSEASTSRKIVQGSNLSSFWSFGDDASSRERRNHLMRD